jgi:predicted SPOUT superfamily RNA methylase MTH1
LEKKRLVIAVPASVISDTPHLREKTSKIGLIGRAAAIFRVNEIVVYRDNPTEEQTEELDLVSTLLSYMETPQYLRKRLFRIEPKLQYAGILPPLRTPHHPISGRAEALKTGDYREGVILSQAKEGLLVDIGVEKPALLREKQHKVGERLTLQVVKAEGQTEVQEANRSEVPDYWGYVVTTERRSLKAAIQNAQADLTLGTSRKGSGFADVAGELAHRWREAAGVLVVFGSPARGLYEIAADEGWRLGEVLDFVVNTVPSQGTETVRMEEALFATLAVLNLEFGSLAFCV